MTVAMLERNLMRLYYNFHHPDRRVKLIGQGQGDGSAGAGAGGEAKVPSGHVGVGAPWYGSLMQVYTACVATAILAMVVSSNKQ